MGRVRLDNKTLQAVTRILRSGNLRAGAVTEEFEARFAAEVGAKYAIAVNSGTAALHIVYAALLRPGDEVIVPDFTFIATASMVLAAGAKPVLADVDQHTFTLNPTDVERKITPRTKAIAPVHLYGHPAAIPEITDVAKRHNLKIIWDAAQAHGACFQGNDVGSFPDAVCYSFYPSKNLTTGEGGMVATSDPDLARELRLLRSHGERARYDHVRIGFNYRTTDIASAIGLGQLESLGNSIEQRRRHASMLARSLADLPGIHLPVERDQSVHAYNLFTIRIEPGILGVSRDEFRKSLLEMSIETAVHYPKPLHRQPALAGLGEDADFPISTILADTVVSLPVHPALTSKEIRRIIHAVQRVAKGTTR